jgi:hypothetical protein
MTKRAVRRSTTCTLDVPRADRPIMGAAAEKAVGYWRKWQRDLPSASWNKILQLFHVTRPPSAAQIFRGR